MGVKSYKQDQEQEKIKATFSPVAQCRVGPKLACLPGSLSADLDQADWKTPIQYLGSTKFGSVYKMCFPGGSDGKESACNTGDLDLIPRLGRSS